MQRRAADRSESRGVRFACLQALGAIGTEARAAVPTLLPLLKEGRADVFRHRVAQVLWVIDPEAARKAGVPRGLAFGGDRP